MAVTANQYIEKNHVDERSPVPVGAGERLYGGTMVFTNATGYGAATTASGANLFSGINRFEVDNTGGADGDLTAETWRRGLFLLKGSGFTMADRDKKAYASDNYTVTTTPTDNTYIGTIKVVESATDVRVDIDPQAP